MLSFTFHSKTNLSFLFQLFGLVASTLKLYKFIKDNKVFCFIFKSHNNLAHISFDY